ncbi:MAG: hypothetical protein AMS27_13730 [Bacteroides sp. SM23_62_1]|nr:MAG: hypothetical protein AMS27_13730 [Bacteroides sp. SM23_62_1]
MIYRLSPFLRKLLWYILVGISIYWLGNVLVVFPWLVSKTLGIIAMFLSTILWGYISFYCLKHSPKKDWNRDTIYIALSFLITAVVQDYFLYAVYRGVPDELYEPTTFLAYGLVFLLPFFVRYVILRKYELRNVLVVTNTKLIITMVVGVISFLLTIWSVRYW